MSEQSLWIRVRNAVGSEGHFERREFNPLDGVPDVSWCYDGVEGHIELKHMPVAPARATTAVFGARTARGMRDSQIAWFSRRLRAGGRGHILAQVEGLLYLLHGRYAPTFNELTLSQLKEVSMWTAGPQINFASWRRFLVMLCGKF